MKQCVNSVKLKQWKGLHKTREPSDNLYGKAQKFRLFDGQASSRHWRIWNNQRQMPSMLQRRETEVLQCAPEITFWVKDKPLHLRGHWGSKETFHIRISQKHHSLSQVWWREACHLDLECRQGNRHFKGAEDLIILSLAEVKRFKNWEFITLETGKSQRGGAKYHFSLYSG